MALAAWLSWPARGVDVVLPLDPAALEAVAAGCPAPPEVIVEAHHPGFDDLTPGPPLGLDAHRPDRDPNIPARRPPGGGTRHWPHHDPEPDPEPGDPATRPESLAAVVRLKTETW